MSVTNGAFTMPDKAVTCTYTNTRTENKVTLEKKWVNSKSGDKADLKIQGGTGGDKTGTSTAPTDSAIDTQVASGAQVTVSEVLPGANAGTYTSELVCKAGADPVTVTNGAFTMPNKAVTCTYTNTRTKNKVSLEKVWAGGKAGDKAELKIVGGITDPATATSTANDAPAPGNTASTDARSGDTITVSENLPGTNTGNYSSELVCKAGTDPVTVTNGAFTMPNKAVTCTYTNTRTENKVTLEKKWVNSKSGDKADLKIQGGTGGDKTGTSTAPTDSAIDTQVASGAQVTVSEVLPGANAGTYTSELVCKAGTDPVTVSNGVFTMPNKAVTCTYTNTRTKNKVSLEKVWAGGKAGDKAELKIVGGITDPAEATSTANDAPAPGNTASTDARSGDTVTVSENLPGTNTGNYTSALVCKAGTDTVSVTNGAFTMPDKAVTCTYTNTRTENKLELTKKWEKALDGDKADLKIVGGTTDPAVATAVAPDAATAQTPVKSGEQVTVSENLPNTNAGAYDATLKCVKTGTDEEVNGSADGTFPMPNYPVTCTYTNTRTSNGLELKKEWIDGIKDDTATLTIVGGTGDDKSKVSTSNGDTGSWTDNTNVAQAQVLSGDEFDVTEVLGAQNKGTYEKSVVCKAGNDTLVPGQDGKYTMPNKPVTCTYTNELQSGQLEITKVFDAKNSGFDGKFKITYDCVNGFDGFGEAQGLPDGPDRRPDHGAGGQVHVRRAHPADTAEQLDVR